MKGKKRLKNANIRVASYAKTLPGGGYMKGSIHFLQDRWFVQVYWQGQKYRIWRYQNEPIWHRKTALKLLNTIRAEIDRGTFQPRTYFPDSPLSVREYAENWVKVINVKESTRRDYKNSIRNHIAPYFGDKDIRHIRYIDLENFYKDIKRSEKGKYNVMGCMRTLLRWAYKNEDIEKVPPFPALKIGELPEVKYLTPEQQEKVLSKIPERHRPIFMVGMEYGLRTQEVRAICWDGISENELTIKRSFSLEKLQETTKTSSIRKYGLTPYVKSILKNLIVTGSKFVFVTERGTPYTSDKMNEIWHQACKDAGIEIKLYNGLRHSFGCNLLDEGTEFDIVQDGMGHKVGAMTKRYTKRSNDVLTKVLTARRNIHSIDRLLTVNK